MHDPAWTNSEHPDSDEIYRSLFHNMRSGVAYCRMLFQDGRPIDFVYLIVNSAFTTQIGFHDVVGKKVTEVIPGLKQGDPDVFDRYARVALTGKPDSFEIYSEPLKKWFMVSLHSPKPEHFVAILDNITERKEAEERERHTKSIYHALSETNEAILKLKSTGELYSDVCRIAVEYGGMAHAWIGVPDSEGHFIPVGRYGIFANPTDRSKLADTSYQITVLATPDRPEGRGPSGIAFRENRTVVVNDIHDDERLAPWHELAKRGGTRAMAAFPIVKSGRPYGVFSVYSDQPDVFDEEIVALLEGMVHNLGFALDSLERETLLRESEARFRTLFENARDGILIVDMAGRLIDTNACGAQMLGYSRDEIRRLKVRDILSELERSRVPDNWEGWEVGSNAVSEWVFLRKDGSTFEGEVNSQLLPDGRFMGILRDVTERKKIEQEMAKFSEQLQLALDAANMGWWHYDVATDKVTYDERYQRICGFSGESLGSKDVLNRTHPDDRAKLQENMDAALNPVNPEPYEIEVRIVLDDGSVRWIQAHGIATVEGEGKNRHATEMVGTVADITEKKEAAERLIESEEKFRTLVEGASDAVFVHDMDGRIVEVNKMACDSLGYTRDELLQMSVFDVDPDFDPKYAKSVWSQPARGEVITIPSRHHRKDGTLFPVEVRISSILVSGQRLFIALVRDVTERERAEEAQRLAATIYRDSSEAMIVLDENHMIVMVNQAFANITGYDSTEVIGRKPSFLRAGQHDEAFYDGMWQQVDETGRFKGETWQKKKNGQFFAVQVTVNAIAGERGIPQRYVVLLSDITEKKLSDDMIWNQANFDTLTGLPNRRFFRDRLEHEVRNAKRSKLPLALLFIDLDGFKDVNDTLGHDMGDMLLKEAAGRLYHCVRESDTVARLGGDEFTVILTELHDPGNADRVAHHILQTLSEPVTLGNEVAYVSASVGITLFPSDAVDVENLIRNADQAMYEAKQRGKNQYQYFTPAMQNEAIKRMRLVNDMRNALERNEFEIMYQPIVELSTGRILKAEALIRWRHPRIGLINPVEFISAAEDTGMITSFGNWVFHEAAKLAALWREKYYPDFQISVNISPVQFRKEGIDPAVWLEHLKGLSLPGQGIVVEITEGLLLDVSPKVSEQLLMLRDAGIEVALDDFGTGYSSLAYLQKFNIDYLKIDQAFIRNLTADSGDMALCEAIIVMAHKLDIKVIAEGIETGSQRELMADAGCDFAQGYLFSKPVSADEFERLVQADPC